MFQERWALKLGPVDCKQVVRPHVETAGPYQELFNWVGSAFTAFGGLRPLWWISKFTSGLLKLDGHLSPLTLKRA